jgi:hypothetical protein
MSTTTSTQTGTFDLTRFRVAVLGYLADTDSSWTLSQEPWILTNSVTGIQSVAFVVKDAEGAEKSANTLISDRLSEFAMAERAVFALNRAIADV